MEQQLTHKDLPLFKSLWPYSKITLLMSIPVAVVVFIGISFFIDYSEPYYANKYIDAFCLSLLAVFFTWSIGAAYVINRNLYSKVLGYMPDLPGIGTYSWEDLAVQRIYKVEPYLPQRDRAMDEVDEKTSVFNISRAIAWFTSELIIEIVYPLTLVLIWIALNATAIILFLSVFRP